MPAEELSARLRDLASCGGPAGPLLDLAETWDSATTSNVLGDLAITVALALADLAAQVESGPAESGSWPAAAGRVPAETQHRADGPDAGEPDA